MNIKHQPMTSQYGKPVWNQFHQSTYRLHRKSGFNSPIYSSSKLLSSVQSQQTQKDHARLQAFAMEWDVVNELLAYMSVLYRSCDAIGVSYIYTYIYIINFQGLLLCINFSMRYLLLINVKKNVISFTMSLSWEWGRTQWARDRDVV